MAESLETPLPLQNQAVLRANKCRNPNDNTTIVEMDPGSFRTFDLGYYKLLLKRRGLFVSDAALTTDSNSRSFVTQFARGSVKSFYEEFADSMEKMGRIDVKTGSSGDVSDKRCSYHPQTPPFINGPFWEVPTGRRDGRVSIASEAMTDLPSPFSNITELRKSFYQKDLNIKDLVVLSGGHTIGNSHCPSFSNRLYNFTGDGDSDPTMDRNYMAKFKNKCKPGDLTSIVEMDPGSFKTFDEAYYVLVDKRRGLFQSDAALLDDADQTKAFVKHQAATRGSTFFSDFGVSMVKMGKIGVLTGKASEVRKRCSVVN